jgi:excinuclease ABC subunit C
MPVQDLKEQIARLPEQPGVYLWGNPLGETIYIGKARSLRDRVRSYLGAYGSSLKTDALLDDIARLEVIVTDSVSEALALENNLIKQRRPRYNILLRDDKNYPYLKLTTGEAFPRLLIARQVESGRDLFAGPFLPARFARRTIDLVHRMFGIRSCNETITGRRDRPCLEYDIKRCIAPCVSEVCSLERYADAVTEAKLLLNGRTKELSETLLSQMTEAAAAERFEEAARLRDAVRTIETLSDRQQKVATPQLGDRDVFGLKTGPSGAVVQVFVKRRGRIVERVELATDPGAVVGSAAEVLLAGLQQYYETRIPPVEIDVPVVLDDDEAVEGWLAELAGRRVRLRVPKRGDRRALVSLVSRNAELSYRTRFNAITAANFDALETLRAVLVLPALPRRIEGFDVSTFQGSETVASMVVCVDGRMQKRQYRKFRIRGQRAEVAPDDCGAMREVVMRRYAAALETGGPFPDLVLVDGGRGQLSAAYQALESLGLGNLIVVGIAKKEELIVTRDRTEPIAFNTSASALLLLQRIRDEAHRFAVMFHRRARRMRDLRSKLDDIPGIGSRRRKALLATFGSVAGVRRATREELNVVVGSTVAATIIDYFAVSS